MSIRRPFYLMTTSLVVAGLVVGPLPSYAQNADQPPYDQGQAADPPARVGSLAAIDGTVSYHAEGETNWVPAVLNTPVSDGDSFWTEPQALANIDVGASSLWLASATEFDVLSLDNAAMHVREPQGASFLHLRALQPGETYTIDTPRGTVTIARNGRYEIVAGDTQNPTTVTVVEGAAEIDGTNLSLPVAANQTATITGTDSLNGSVGPEVEDDFVRSMLQREPAAVVQDVQPPPVVAQMTGGQDLNAYGSWQDNPDYGQVWYPQVGPDWAPYREGRWSYVAPWGWTWIDAEPWGFAPFHYGRWVQIGPRWGWAPVYPGYDAAYTPVYAPALVTFFGIGAALGVGVALGLGLGAAFGPDANVGWVPLGPREPYFPPYRASRVYLNRVNVTNIRNVTNIYNEVGTRRTLPISAYANARAATLVPARAMADSRPVGSSFLRPTAAQLTGSRGLVAHAPIAPSGHTLGLTPHVAQALRVTPQARPQAPGPAIHAIPVRAAHPPLPPLAPGRGPAQAPTRLQQASPPALRTPGASPIGSNRAVDQRTIRAAPPAATAQPQIHIPAQRPVAAPPAGSVSPQSHMPAPRPIAAPRPPAYHPPVYHPPVQRPAYHAPTPPASRPQYHPQYHRAVAAPRPAPRLAPRPAPRPAPAAPQDKNHPH